MQVIQCLLLDMIDDIDVDDKYRISSTHLYNYALYCISIVYMRIMLHFISFKLLWISIEF